MGYRCFFCTLEGENHNQWSNVSGWWFQPSWKYESQWEGISHLLWEKTCLKPPTIYIYTIVSHGIRHLPSAPAAPGLHRRISKRSPGRGWLRRWGWGPWPKPWKKNDGKPWRRWNKNAKNGKKWTKMEKLVGGFNHLEKSESQWERWHPIYEMENNPNVWNHQPAMFHHVFDATTLQSTIISLWNITFNG